MATILVIDDNETIREGLAHTVRAIGHEVDVADNGVRGIAAFKKRRFDFVITDLKMDGADGVSVLRELAQIDPDVPTMLMTAFGSVETAVEAMKFGAFDFLTKPFSAEVVRLKVQQALVLVETRRAQRRLQAENDYLRAQGEPRHRFSDLVGRSNAMQQVYRVVEKVAKTESSVLIQGESGTGKELVARAIHENSPRKDGPFIRVNCGALTETLFESELFGHEKGAFTGAIRTKLGRFELANGGTLFLDEVGDIPLAMQVKILRVLQEREFERVGGEQTISVDVRMVAATHRDLETMVSQGAFREDLFYRLHVVPVTLPALRDRRQDIALLAQHFLEKLAPKMNSTVVGLSDDALARLFMHTWPGNVRELESAIEQALVFSEGELITPEALPGPLAGKKANMLEVPKTEMSLPEILEDLERQLIVRAYEKANGVKTETAHELGIKTSALYYKLEKYGIS